MPHLFLHAGSIMLGTTSRLRGFTIVELVTIIMIVGILAAIAVPRFFDRNTFDSRGFYDQAIAALRYAQKVAVAEHRNVCVTFTPNSIVLTQVAGGAACPGTAPGNNLLNPANGSPYSVSSSNASLSGFSNFSFNSLGQPSAPQTISVSGYTVAPIRVEAETGYVH